MPAESDRCNGLTYLWAVWTGVAGGEREAGGTAGLTHEHVGDSPVERLLRRLPFTHGGLHGGPQVSST